jgi:FKBP-type peptidyl-prolyl cis-trans isomerase
LPIRPFTQAAAAMLLLAGSVALAPGCACRAPRPTEQSRRASDPKPDAASPATADPAAPGQDPTEPPPDPNETPEQPRLPQAEGLRVERIRPGRGVPVEADDWVTLRLTGRLLDGEVFHDPGHPEGPWPLTSLIEGLARGIRGMSPGEVRRITIAPKLAYAEREIRDPESGGVLIPPGATLIYEVELLEVRPPGTPEPGPEESAGQPPEAGA